MRATNMYFQNEQNVIKQLNIQICNFTLLSLKLFLVKGLSTKTLMRLRTNKLYTIHGSESTPLLWDASLRKLA